MVGFHHQKRTPRLSSLPFTPAFPEKEMTNDTIIIKKILLAGGTGFIGSRLNRTLQNNGIRTCLVSRMPRPDSITWEDLSHNGLPKQTDAVINVAGQNVLDPLRRWTPGFKQNVIASRVHTNQMLADAIRKTPPSERPRVFLTISGVGYYKPDPEETYDENSPGGDHDFLSKLCRDWENAAKIDDTVRTVVVRSGVVLERSGGMIQQMYPLFYLGLGAKIGSGQQYMPWIHLDDLCHIFLKSIQNPKFSGIINGVAPETVTNEQFTKAFARALRRPSFLTIPEPILNLMFNPERAVMMTRGQKVISKRMANELGYQPQFGTLDQAFKEIVFGGK